MVPTVGAGTAEPNVGVVPTVGAGTAEPNVGVVPTVGAGTAEPNVGDVPTVGAGTAEPNVGVVPPAVNVGPAELNAGDTVGIIDCPAAMRARARRVTTRIMACESLLPQTFVMKGVW